MIYALFIFTACVIACCVSIALRKPSQAEVLLVIPFSLSSVGFACQAFPSWIDRQLGITNGSDIAHHCLAVITMTSSLLFSMTLKPPRRVSNTTLIWSASLSGLLILLVVLQWLYLPGRSIESPSDASGWQTLNEPFAPVTVIYLAYMMVGFAVLAWQCIWGAKSRFTDLPAARRGSFTMGVGIILMGLSQSLIVLRLFTPLSSYARLTSLFWFIVYIQTIVFSAGLLFPIVSRHRQRQTAQQRDLDRLTPLWEHLGLWFPATHLSAGTHQSSAAPSGRVVSEQRWSVTETLIDRYVEVGDCLTRLMLPLAAIDALLDELDPATALGRYIGDRSTMEAVGAEGGESAMSVLPVARTPQIEQRQLLAVADGFREAATVTT